MPLAFASTIPLRPSNAACFSSSTISSTDVWNGRGVTGRRRRRGAWALSSWRRGRTCVVEGEMLVEHRRAGARRLGRESFRTVRMIAPFGNRGADPRFAVIQLGPCANPSCSLKAIPTPQAVPAPSRRSASRRVNSGSRYRSLMMVLVLAGPARRCCGFSYFFVRARCCCFSFSRARARARMLVMA